MRATTFDDTAEFLAALRPLIAAAPDRCNTLNTVLHNQLASPYSSSEPVQVALIDDVGAVLAAALQTPPYPLTVVISPATSDESALAIALTAAVLAKEPTVEAVSGPAADTRAFVGAWCAVTGAVVDQSKRLLLHRLGDFRPPVGVRGEAREAVPSDASDTELIASWWYDFALEARTHPRPSSPNRGVLANRAARGHATLLWCIDDRPVAVAGAGAVVDGGVRIGPVYTPRSDRGHRFGSAVTAAAVNSARGRGATSVELFTDADYPTSNNIYRRLGFEQIEIFEEVTLRPGR